MKNIEDEAIHNCILPINGTISELINVPEENGVCIDVSIHSTNRVLFLEKSTMLLDNFLRAWSKCLEITSGFKRTLIICVRSHSIEEPCLELLKKHGIKDYFFHGSSFLDIFNIKTQLPDRAKFAYRYSEYEGIEDLLRNPEIYDWILIDSLKGQNLLDSSLYNWANKNGIQICVKSPELNGLKFNPDFFQKIDKYKNITLLIPFSYS